MTSSCFERAPLEHNDEELADSHAVTKISRETLVHALRSQEAASDAASSLMFNLVDDHLHVLENWSDDGGSESDVEL
jgi:hypothetical protein